MQIIEQTIIPKRPSQAAHHIARNLRSLSEDGIVVTDDFIAVIDGSTSKALRRYSLLYSNGRYAMLTVATCLKKMPKDISCHQFCIEVTRRMRRHYRKSQMEWLLQHPEERLAASAIVFSRVRREIWLIGDCQCLVGGTHYDNPKPYEDIVAQKRADIIRAQGCPPEYLEHDEARQAVLPLLIESMQGQNRDYAVIDGFPIPEEHVRIITLDFQPWEIVLASDGYPFLCPTLAESEERLAWQREHDPLNTGEFKATKGFMKGNNSFDDRSYIRFKV